MGELGMNAKNIVWILFRIALALACFVFVMAQSIRAFNRPDYATAERFTVAQSLNALLLSSAEFMTAKANANSLLAVGEFIQMMLGTAIIGAMFAGVVWLVWRVRETEHNAQDAVDNRVAADIRRVN